MQRTLEPEILDSLSPNDPEAQLNRRDLRIINGIMGNYRWFGRTLPKEVLGGERILEVGAGTGELGIHLAARGMDVDGLDLWPRPAGWAESQAWHASDLRTFERYGDYAVVIANLILHQFSDRELAELGRVLRRTVRVIVACEPARARLWQVLCAASGVFFGASRVTRHDAHVSIAAGFQGDELGRALGLDERAWIIRRTSTLSGAYRMVAIRRT